MQAGQLISDAIPALQHTDTVQKALERMHEFRISHLPVVSDQQFLGLLSEEDLIGVKNIFSTIAENNLNLMSTFVYNNAHILEVTKIIAQQKISALPVLNLHKGYDGVIVKSNLIQTIASEMSLDTSGAILVLNISTRDLSMSQIAQIVESNHAQLIASYVTSFPNSTRLEVTIKVNVSDVKDLKSDFERYEYEIKAIYNQSDTDQHMLDRYNALMNYLSV